MEVETRSTLALAGSALYLSEHNREVLYTSPDTGYRAHRKRPSETTTQLSFKQNKSQSLPQDLFLFFSP